jgi:exopolyphosphatase/guanosine-5'-triphosphate,3'-diphosphate pyrophosphatase
MKLDNRPYFLDKSSPRHTQGKLAVIDIGSSMVRLVVYDDITGYPHLILNEKVWVALGEGKKNDNFSLSAAKIQRTISVLEWFVWICEKSGCESIIAVATAAVREAKNKDAFIKSVRKKTGLHVEVLDGDAEARLAAAGAVVSIPNATGLVMDLGGGSMELCETHGAKRVISIPKGVLSIKAESNDNPVEAIDILKKEIKKTPWLQKENHTSLIALGSGMRSIAKLYMEEKKHPLKIVHDFRIERDEIIRFCRDITKKKVTKISDLTKEWQEVLPFRAAALCAIMESTNLQNIRFATFGIREGLLFTQSAQCTVCDDPFIAYTTDVARRDGKGMGYANALAEWAAPYVTDIEPRLLKAAACYCEIAWREQPLYRALSIFDQAIGGSYVGVGHNTRARLALISFFRHEQKLLKGMKEQVGNLVSGKQIHQAKIVGTLFRLASMLDPGFRGLLSSFSLEETADGYTLNAPKAFLKMESESVNNCLRQLNILCNKEG